MAPLAALALLWLCSSAAAEVPQTPQSPAAPRCDDFDPSVCLQPFPNDYFTVLDPNRQTSGTGRRINFSILAMPRNALGKPIDPTEWNRNDGFSPGSLITVHVPGLDNQQAYAQTNPVPIHDLAAYLAPSAPVVVIDATDRALPRWPIWTELDANASSDSVRNLMIRPAVNFTEGHRYIVALRSLKDSMGNAIPAPPAFVAFRDHRCVTCNPSQPYPGGEADRAAHMESIFRTLARAGIARSSLYLAWDFTVASERNLSERLLHIRNDAFGQLGETPKQLAQMKIPASSAPPRFVVTSVTDYAPGGEIARQVQGRFYVPCYLTTFACASGGSFYYPAGEADPNLPGQLPGNVYEGRFVCNIPWAATIAAGRPSLYGHGLFGSRFEIDQQQLHDMAQEHDYVFCATDEIGMACALDTPPVDLAQLLAEAELGVLPETPNCDIPNVVTAIADLSRFNTLVDRVQEGFLAELYLGRLMVHPRGFASNPAFQYNGKPVIDTTSPLYYDGNSQGGILGGAVTALMVDGNRSTLGVPAMNFSALLQRSTDFGTGAASEGPPQKLGFPSFAWLLYHAYPSEADRQVLLGLLQMIWDRGEADGYAEHMTTNPLPNTPAHAVLMQVAFGDHQVTNWAAGVEARTIGAYIHTPILDPARDPTGGSQYFGMIPPIPYYPWPGSAIVVWDSGAVNSDCSLGVGAPPFTDTPPIAGCPAGVPPQQWGGNDPHELPRETPAARLQKSEFDQPAGMVYDVCGGQPCHSVDYSGTP